MGRWRKVRRIAVAGQAEIYLVENADTGEQAVMKKLLKTPQLDDPDAELRRFHREVRCQSAMEHDGIMPILGFNFGADPPFYLMPVAEETLADVITRHPTGMDSNEAAGILLGVLDTIEYAHQQGVYHRDLKPGNILKVSGR